MGDVLRFPIMPRQPAIARQPVRVAIADPPAPTWSPIVEKIINVVWGITTLCWVFLRFIIPVVVFWKFLRMVALWNTPGEYAGWQFLAYFAGYTALYAFVAGYRPKSMRGDANRGGTDARK